MPAPAPAAPPAAAPTATPPAAQPGQAPPPAAAQTPPKPKGDPKALAEFASKWLNLSSSKLPKKPDEPPAEPAPAEPPAEPAAETPPAAPTPPPPKKPRRPASPPPPNIEQVVEATAQGVVRAMEEAKAKEPKTPPPAPEEASLSGEDKRKVETLREMERLFPDQYKGIADKYVKGLKATADYVARWERDNPGQEFNNEDPQHEAFFAQNDVDWSDEDYLDARAEIRARNRVEQSNQKISGELDELRKKDKVREAAPLIDVHQAMTARHFFSLVDPKAAAVVREDGTVDREALEKLQQEDPLMADVVIYDMASKRLEPLAGEIYRLYEGLVDYNPDKNPAHTYLGQFAVAKEQEMLSMPEDQQLNEKGQRFVTSDQYRKMSEAQRKRHWTFGHMDLSILLADEMAKEARKTMEAEKQKLKRYAKYVEANGAAANTPPPDEPEEPPVNPRGKPQSPSAVTSPKVAAGGNHPSATPQSALNAFKSKFLS